MKIKRWMIRNSCGRANLDIRELPETCAQTALREA
jgi:hypothetical protein